MKSMTGYAALDVGGRRWDIRSVNARGFDLRLRLPEGLPELEPLARKMVGAVAQRGNVTLSLRLAPVSMSAARLDPDRLSQALQAIAEVEAAAQDQGLPLAPTTAVGILSLRGLWDTHEEADIPPRADLREELTQLLAAFTADRAREGDSLRRVVADQVDQIAALTARADGMAPERRAHIARTFAEATARLTAATGAGMDPDRVAQEIAALAVKADIAEELDRLTAHIAAARDLLTQDGPVGRRLDFLTQEFNREANTLCSKAGMARLTAIGLDLKTVIDRLREQVQNLE
ncbi:YicC/YloC family endoribonuclease [Jannaschia sp. M317]|uniref:YicC/YloC family endoribonuclease n=1 Tax=Jannaschia sp. M317 TaxID=2867011 RepID=UPI0021A3FE69|nr:YicC/YloC family endoribonuclease [Jannaschia sp. M317]